MDGWALILGNQDYGAHDGNAVHVVNRQRRIDRI